MPRTLPSGMELELKRPGGFMPYVLMDVQTADGTNYFWSDFAGTFPAVIVAGNQVYSPWIKSAGPFHRTKDLTSDTADMIMQNVSGNTIDRDVALALKNHEFEGALAIVRLWMPLLNDVLDSFFTYLTEQSPSEDECSFRMLQIFDPAQYDVADDVIGELCTWRYKDAMCGSTGSALTCPKRFIDCIDATRTASERFNGILSIVPNANLNPPPVGLGGGGGGGNGDGGDGGAGGGFLGGHFRRVLG